MWKNRADLYNLIVNMKAHIYICGGAKMAADVTKMLENILLENDNKISKDCIKELKVLIKPNTDLYGIWSIVVLKDKRLASGSYDEIIRIWDINNESVIEELSGHTSWIYSIVFHPDNILISGSDDKTIRIWNLSN